MKFVRKWLFLCVLIICVLQLFQAWFPHSDNGNINALENGGKNWKATSLSRSSLTTDNDSNTRDVNKAALHVNPPKVYVSTKNSTYFKSEFIQYDQFNITEPQFITNDHRRIFRKDPRNVGACGIPSGEKLIGRIYAVKNGTFRFPYECGYRSNVDFVVQKRPVSTQNWYHTLVPLIVPDGWSFQHFIDGTLPKIIQALEYLQDPEAKLLLQEPRDSIIWEMLRKLNVTKDKVVLDSGATYGATNLLFSCITPPLHPSLWQKARGLLGSPDILQVSRKDALVVVVSRKGCHNCGRTIKNIEEMLNLLRAKFGADVVRMFEGPIHLQNATELFGKAKLIIGPHGGGMYNLLFCPSDTTVIEIMPTDSNSNIPKYYAGAHQIIWHQAVLMGQTYWRFPTKPVNIRGDSLVDMTLLSKLLDVAFPSV